MNREKLDKIKAQVTKLFVKLYAKSDKFDTLNAVRAHVYRSITKILSLRNISKVFSHFYTLMAYVLPYML